MIALILVDKIDRKIKKIREYKMKNGIIST